MARFDFNEPVTIVWNTEIVANADTRATPTNSRLSEAVRHLVPRWSAKPTARLCIIRRNKGRKPITTYKQL